MDIIYCKKPNKTYMKYWIYPFYKDQSIQCKYENYIIGHIDCIKNKLITSVLNNNSIDYHQIYKIYDLLLEKVFIYQNLPFIHSIHSLINHTHMSDIKLVQYNVNIDNIYSSLYSIKSFELEDTKNKFHEITNTNEFKYIEYNKYKWTNEYSQQFIFLYICNWICNLYTIDFLIINSQLIPIHEKYIDKEYNIPFDFKKLFFNKKQFFTEYIIGYMSFNPNLTIFKDFLGDLYEYINNIITNNDELYIDLIKSGFLYKILNRIDKMYRYFD